MMTQAEAEFVLNLSEPYTIDDLKRAKREMMKVWHPDIARNRGIPAGIAEPIFTHIIPAEEMLSCLFAGKDEDYRVTPANVRKCPLDRPPVQTSTLSTKQGGGPSMRSATVSSVAKAKEYHPLPRHIYVSSKWVLPCLAFGSSALSILGVRALPRSFFSGETERYMCILYCLIPVFALVAWALWSVLTYYKNFRTNPITGNRYIIHRNGILNIFGDAGNEYFVDVENKVIDYINQTDIPYFVADGNCIDVKCSCYDEDMYELNIDYPSQYDIRDCLERMIIDLFQGETSQIKYSSLENGHDRIGTRVKIA